MEEILVDREQFLQCLKSISKVRTSAESAKAVIWTDAGDVFISLPGMELSAEAGGQLTGRIRTPVNFWKRLARIPPVGDPVPISVIDGTLRVAGSATPCSHMKAAPRKIELPQNPSQLQLLKIGYHHKPAEIEQAGLLKPVLEAGEWRDGKISSAQSILVDFGVTFDEIKQLVDNKIRHPQPENQ